MENKFNKKRFAIIMLQTFIIAYTHGRDITAVYAKLREKVNTNIETEKDEEKRRTLDECRKILEKCRDFFKDASIKKSVDHEISIFRDEMNSTIGRNPSDTEIAKRLLSSFSDEFWGDGKRKYNMSQLATTDTISTFKSSQGDNVKAEYVSFEDEQKNNKDKSNPPSKHLQDKRGNTIDITYMGRLIYNDGICKKNIYKFHIEKVINNIKSEYEKFSNLDINTLDLEGKPEFCDVVVSELLSDANLNHPENDDYIGEITTAKYPYLEPQDERLDSGFYRYQINQKYALEYEGEKLEAIRAYKQQEALKAKIQESEKDDDSER